MIVNPDMLKSITATSSVAPIPTIIPTPLITIEAGDVGKRTLWVGVVIFGLSSLALYGLAFRVPVQKRLFHVLTSFITTFAFLSYFAMATGDGIGHNSYTETVHHHKNVPNTYQDYSREIYWARYVDWAVTTPLLLLDLSLLAGLSGANILIAVVADVIMILTGLFASFGSKGSQTWGWYAWACIAYLVIVYQLAFNGRTAVANKDSKTKTFYASIAGFTLILWTIYPIVWGLSEGGHVIDINQEIVAYAVLDILAKPVFGFWLLFTHDSMSSTSPSLEGFWSQGFGSQGTLRVGDDD